MQLTVRDVARLLSVSEKSVYRWISQGSLPAYRVNDQYRFNRAELLEWATSRKINVSPEVFTEPEAPGTALPAFSEALRAGGIFYRLEATGRDSALRAIVEQVRLPPEVDREFLFRVLLSRERLGSTGIGDGIAIPHVRNPIVLHVPSPTVTLCFLERPVEFSAIDGKPVGTLFTLISPTVRAHLHLLARLSFALRDDRFCDAVQRQAAREEIFAAAQRVEDALPPPAAAGRAGGEEDAQ